MVHIVPLKCYDDGPFASYVLGFTGLEGGGDISLIQAEIQIQVE
jgi:hypothetical protein